MLRLVASLLLATTAACGPEGSKKPAGTTADPVEVCERMGDVCRIDKARLGVCVENDGADGFTCQPQH